MPRLRLLATLALLAGLCVSQSGCLAMGVAGAAVGVTAKTVGVVAKGAGMVVGAVLPGGGRKDDERRR